MDTEALWLTLRLAATTTLVLLALGVPLAWWIAQGCGHAYSPARAIAQAVVALPLVLPPTVIGFYLLVGLGPLTAIGRSIATLLGHPLAFSFSGLLLGSMVYSLPFAVQPMVAGFRTIDQGYLEAAAGLGVPPLARFLRMSLPMARTSLLASAVLTFTHTVGEFGVVLMVGGNIPGTTRTLSIALYDRVQDGDLSGANSVALWLIGFSVVALLAIYWRSGAPTRRGVTDGL
jgi:molybdate transport system permease protein